MNFLLILQLFLGVILAFYGAAVFRSMAPLGGLILGGLLGITVGELLVPAANYTGWTPYLFFIGAGLVGAMIAVPLKIVIIVISSGVLGAIAGAIIGFLIQNQAFPLMLLDGTFTLGNITTLQIWLMAIIAVIFGFLSIQYENFLFYASTGFIGSLMITTAISQLSGAGYPLLRNSIFLFFLFITLGLLGTIWQNYHTDE